MLTLFHILILFSMSASVNASDDEDADFILPYVQIEHVTDFSQLGETALDEEKLILLEISATDCGFCELLEEDYLKPMLRDENYTRRLLIRKINLDDFGTIQDFAGEKTTTEDFARRYKAHLTPTMLFLDSSGKEVAERIVGINTLELFGGYIEASIENGRKAIGAKD